MAQSWNLTLKPSFLNELMALDPKEMAEVQKKLAILTEDPTHAPPLKKRLSHVAGNLHRLRWKQIRIFYTFEEPYVSVLALRKRDRAYETDLPDPEKLGGGDVADVDEAAFTPAPDPAGSWERWLDAPKPAQSEESIAVTGELLERLRVPQQHRMALLSAKTADDLLELDHVPEDVRLRVIDALVGRSLQEVERQPDLLVQDTDDLIRYREGELLGFLLKLSPEQEKLVTWASNAKGPTLIKGGPGTGKSTVALYRVRVLIDALRKSGVERPRIVFTTYTNALVRFSEQLLGSLLGKDARLVDVKTADSIAVAICAKAHGKPDIVQNKDLKPMIERAIREARFTGNSLVQAAQRQTIERLGRDYLAEELLGVIQGRGLTTLAEYQAAPRPGRGVALNKTQREAVWRAHEALLGILEGARRLSWPQVRARAAAALTSGGVDDRYDAVVIDEAQDLDPVTLQMLVALCRAPNRLFLAADANQSIYGAGFRWTDVHESLRFQGRTGMLKANHRSTREIGEAAQHYLTGGELDEVVERKYVHSGPLPAVRTVSSAVDEARLIARFVRGASRELRLGLGSCAVLCPTNTGARHVAASLQEEGLTARYVEPKDLDLSAPGIKTMTLKSAKGLEFPVVAIGGFLGAKFPYVPHGASDDQRAELLERERRTLFVAMTRAMRALLVVVPPQPSLLLEGFEPARWNLGGTA